jgi:uncharacterized protein (DUF2235 family)
MDYWEPGDKVFLFGFSRGAYTVRVLAALLHSLGLLPHGNHNLVPYAIRLFKAVRGRGAPAEAAEESNYWKLCNEFRWTFARRVTPEDDTRRFRVHYLGVWDTVSSVGWVWDPLKFPYTAANPSIAVIRHAVSVDERRWFFRQNLMQPKGGQDFLELWFPGVHADVGGGYPERDGGLWRTPFNWILTEAVRAGLRVDEQRLQKVLHRSEPSAKPWTDNQHESLRGLWWLAEFFPKVHWHPDRACWSPDIGRGRRRYVPDHALMHKTTLLRIRERADYAPPNLSRAFLEKVRGLGEVPETMPYER